MADLQGFAKQATPVATNLNRSGRDVSRVFQALGPFSSGAPAVARDAGRRPAHRPPRGAAHPAAGAGRRRASPSRRRPLSSDLDKLTASIDKTDGIERLMETIYYTTLVINGFDEQGYYQRANLLNNLCSTYQISTQDGCSARFEGGASASAAAARNARRAGQRPRSGQGPDREHRRRLQRPDAGGPAGHRRRQEGP